jgi:hypothetical protein
MQLNNQREQKQIVKKRKIYILLKNHATNLTHSSLCKGATKILENLRKYKSEQQCKTHTSFEANIYSTLYYSQNK